MMQLLLRSIRFIPVRFRSIHYVQGQYSDPKTREYFYYIDHQGQVNICNLYYRPNRWQQLRLDQQNRKQGAYCKTMYWYLVLASSIAI